MTFLSMSTSDCNSLGFIYVLITDELKEMHIFKDFCTLEGKVFAMFILRLPNWNLVLLPQVKQAETDARQGNMKDVYVVTEKLAGKFK